MAQDGPLLCGNSYFSCMLAYIHTYIHTYIHFARTVGGSHIRSMYYGGHDGLEGSIHAGTLHM